MIYSTRHGLQPADCIIESIFPTGVSKHYAVYLGMDHEGVEWMSENNHLQGVRLVRASDYFARNQRFSIRKFAYNDYERKAAVQRALAELGQPYDLINYNCEHYAEYVQNNRFFSGQVEKFQEGIKVAAVFLIGFCLIKLISNN